MQILELNHSTARTEGRFKALFWPSVRHDGDLEYVTEQAFWICSIVAACTLLFSVFLRSFALGGFECLFYFLAGAGCRQRSRLAAVSAFVAYLLGAFVIQKYTGYGFHFGRLIFLALLFSNMRGVWLAAGWQKGPDFQPATGRLKQTVADKLSDQLPRWIWPRAKWLFACMAVAEIALMVMCLAAPLPRAR